MKKVNLLIFCFGFLFFANAQDKSLDIILKEKNRYFSHDFTQNGLSYFITGNDKSKTDLNVFCYDSDFNLKFTKNFISKYEGLPAFFGRGMNDSQVYYDFQPTISGKYTLLYDDDLVQDENGNTKVFEHDGGKFFKDFNTKFFINNDNFSCFFGYKKVGKKNEDSKEVYFYRYDLNDLSKKIIELKFPEFQALISTSPDNNKNAKKDKEEKSQKWEVAQFDNNQFLMINKELNKERTQNQYNIVSYDYEGNVVKTLSIPIKLKGKYFALSDSGLGTRTIIYSSMYNAGLLSEFATGNVYVEGNNEFYYIYGLYSNTKSSQINKVNFNGFYIYKYNSNGELVWKNEKEIVDSNGFNTTQRPIAVSVDFVLINGNQIGLNMSSFHEEYAQMFLLSSLDGKIIKNKKHDFKIEALKLNAIRVKAFPTGYTLNSYENKNFDINTAFASFLNPKVDTFLKSKTKEDLNYNAKITKNAIYMIEEDTKEKDFRLLKFNF
jgi:hypothetical protein